MTSARAPLSGRPTNIIVPWMKRVGLARNLSRLASFQVIPAFFIAVEKWNPGDGATFAADDPGERWAGLVLARSYRVADSAVRCKRLLPAVGLPAASALEEPRRIVVIATVVPPEKRFMMPVLIIEATAPAHRR